MGKSTINGFSIAMFVYQRLRLRGSKNSKHLVLAGPQHSAQYPAQRSCPFNERLLCYMCHGPNMEYGGTVIYHMIGILTVDINPYIDRLPGYGSVYNPSFDLTLAWTQRSIMTQPRTLVVGSVHLKLWWLNIVKVKRRPGPTIGAPQELVYDKTDKSMHHAHNCSVAKFNPKGSGNQNE